MTRTYAVVGLGHRAYTFLRALLGPHAADGRLVGLCDANPGRLARAVAVAAQSGIEVPGYGADQFDLMVRQTSPDGVIVTVPDHAHCAYIVRAMELGADVITEKPMTIDAESCRQIIAARHATGRSVVVAFNYRYSPVRSLLKQVLMSGIIGHVIAVDFEWQLDTYHGADYFRRWHRNRANSGGLLVHKATHHFDLLNWWLGAVPQRVVARGRRAFYRPETAEAFGLHNRGERCSACPVLDRCRLKLDIASNDHLRALYADNESHDGHFRDRCVFSPDIDIEDSMQAIIEYRNGVIANYLLTAYGPAEGYRAVFHSTRGRVTLKTVERGFVRPDGGLVRPPPPERSRIVVQPLFSQPYELALPKAEGMHGGGDKLLLNHLFGGEAHDRYGLAADERAGAWSALVGMAANASLVSGTPVSLTELASGMPEPDMPPDPFGPATDWESFEPTHYPFLGGARIADTTGI